MIEGVKGVLVLWVGYGMSLKSQVGDVVLRAAVFRGRTLGKWWDHEGSNCISGLTLDEFLTHQVY